MGLLAVGSYTHHAVLDARGRGVSIVEWDGDSGLGAVRDVWGGTRNPTYLAWVPEGRFLYAVSEAPGKRCGAAAFCVDGRGRLNFLGEAEGERGSACHLTVVPEASRMYLASYGDGSLSVFGMSGAVPERVPGGVCYAGSGPDRQRQGSAHAHQVLRGPGGFLYVCDLGSDCVWLHAPEELEAPAELNAPVVRKALTVPAGYGPRHLVFDPVLPAAYVLCELVPRLLVVRVDSASGEMKILQEVDAVDAAGFGIAAPAAVKIHPSGRTLAVSNRFDDTIAVFNIQRPAGCERTEPFPGMPQKAGRMAGGRERSQAVGPRLTLSGRFPCGGRAPRDIEFDSSGRLLFIANQDSHNVSSRRFNPKSGEDAGTWAGGLQTGSPVCVLRLDSS